MKKLKVKSKPLPQPVFEIHVPSAETVFDLLVAMTEAKKNMAGGKHRIKDNCFVVLTDEDGLNFLRYTGRFSPLWPIDMHTWRLDQLNQLLTKCCGSKSEGH